jgi:hypothetical protein
MSGEDGFLSRWSRRKARVREGRPPEEAVPAAMAVPPAPPAAAPAVVASETVPDEPAAPAEPAPTLDDVSSLTPSSDFTRFVARDVDPTVRNAALKKLFTDPHFNVMDGLDIYIDDYGKPDPLPAGMLRQMAQSQLLGLFADAKQAEPAARVEPPTPSHEEPSDEDADLRLQSHDAADAAEPGTGAPGSGEDAAGER